VLLQLYFLSSGKSRVRIDFSKLRVIPELMGRMLSLSFGGMVQYFVGVASWIALVRMNATFGTTAVAGYTIALRVIMFALLPSWGVASAAATMVGQSLGAKKPDRAEQAVWKSGLYNMGLLSALGVVFIASARPVAHIFTDDEAVADMAVLTLRTVACGYPFYAWGMVITQAFNGAGDTRTPTLLNLVCFWGWQIPLAALLAFTFGWGPFGIFIAISVAQSTLAPLSVIWFRKGRWKGAEV